VGTLFPVADQPLVIVSNRGPLSFSLGDDGELITRRGGGGLVTALGPAVAGTNATWIAAALGEADREAAARGIVDAEGFRLRSLVLDPDAYRMYYDVISNSLLWFLYHGLFDLVRRPRIDRRWREAWDSYREVNRAFAAAAAEEAPEGGAVLVQDYHLSLVPNELAAKRPDVRAIHFHHTPFCSPDVLRVLPDEWMAELVSGLSAARGCGFHTTRWARAFESCRREVTSEAPTVFVSPAAVDIDGIRAVAASDACETALEELRNVVGDRRLLVRVDRIELSKNLLRGFHAYDELLRRHAEWRERVVFGAFVYPSRQTLPEYQAYRQEVETLVRRINEEWATSDWTPILYDSEDDFPRSVAALRAYDVLLVNPVRDGLNLVAKEGPLVNERDGVLVLSRESGVWEELSELAVGVNPFDVGATADALLTALKMPAPERRHHAEALRIAVERRTPGDWLSDQIAAAG